MTGKDGIPVAGSGLAGNTPDGARTRSPVPAYTVAQPAAYGLQWVETLDDLMALEADWLELERTSARPNNFFQSFAWCSTWAEIYLGDSSRMALKTLVARDDGAVVMIWPLAAVRHGPVTVLQWLSDPVGQYGDVLIDKDADEAKWFSAAWTWITGDPNIDGIALKHVREDARAFSFLDSKCPPLPEEHLAPQLDLTPFSSSEEYSGALSRNQRSQRSKLRKKLEQDGAVSFDVYRGDSAFAQAVHDALAFKKAWLEERGLKANIIGDPRFQDLITKLGTADPSAAAAGVLSSEGTPLSIDVAFTYEGRYFGCVIAENTSASAKSPTKVHLDLRQKACIEEGFSQFDMMLPASPFKAHWTDGSVVVKDFALAMNLWGLIYCSVYLGRVRPALKRLYYAVGTGPRTALAAAITMVRQRK